MSNIVSELSGREPSPIDTERLTKIIEDAYKTYNEEKDRQKQSFSASQIGYGHGQCPRYWHIAFDGASFVQENAAASWAMMKAGIAAHDRLGDVLERSALDIVGLEEEFFYDDPPIHGFIDAVINRGGEEVIGEIKTTRTEAFRSRKAKMSPPGYHLIQILIYMYVRGAESGFFLYENKNDHSLLVMPVYMRDHAEYVEYLFDWMRRVRKAWEDGQLNKIPFRKNAKECKSCPVRAVCFDSEQYGEGEDLIEVLRQP